VSSNHQLIFLAQIFGQNAIFLGLRPLDKGFFWEIFEKQLPKKTRVWN
jgi:hypothetical protein